jgi:hypothetical protein
MVVVSTMLDKHEAFSMHEPNIQSETIVPGGAPSMLLASL